MVRNFFRVVFNVPMRVYNIWKDNEDLLWGDLSESFNMNLFTFIDHSVLIKLNIRNDLVAKKWLFNDDPFAPSVFEVSLKFCVKKGVKATPMQQKAFKEYFRNHYFGRYNVEENNESYHLNTFEYVEPSEDFMGYDEWIAFHDCDSLKWHLDTETLINQLCQAPVDQH